ncbi:UNVERIFIED_CONTAM: hypothetical protein HDU68_003219, partial [Siphonaria sp. JEL0065]
MSNSTDKGGLAPPRTTPTKVLFSNDPGAEADSEANKAKVSVPVAAITVSKPEKRAKSITAFLFRDAFAADSDSNSDDEEVGRAVRSLVGVSKPEPHKPTQHPIQPALQHLQAADSPEIKRAYSDSTLGSTFKPPASSNASQRDSVLKTHNHKSKHDPRDWAMFKSSTSPAHSPSGHSEKTTPMSRIPSTPNFSSEAHLFEETAEVLKIQNPDEIQGPEDVAKLMKKKGISTWAAVLAVSSGATSTNSQAGTPEANDENHDEDTGTDSIPLKDMDSGDKPAEKPKSSESESVRAVPSNASFFNERKRVRKSQTESELLIQDDVDLEKIKRNFIMKLARTFQMYGAPSHRLEYHMAQVAEALDVKADFILFPGLIMISFGDENYNQNTHFLKAPGGIHMAKLAQVNALCQTLTEKLITIEDAIDLLEGVRAAKDYPEW